MAWHAVEVPKDCVCHNTINGSILQVNHVIEIIAETSKSKTTNPRLTPQMIHLVNEPGYSGPVIHSVTGSPNDLANDDLAEDIANLVINAVVGAAAASATVGLMQKHFGTARTRRDTPSQEENYDKQNGSTGSEITASTGSASSATVKEPTAANITPSETNAPGISATSMPRQGDTPEPNTCPFYKNQRVWYLHKTSGQSFEAVIAAVHFDDGVDCPYFTIRYNREGEMIEKQTTSDRLAAVLPSCSRQFTIPPYPATK